MFHNFLIKPSIFIDYICSKLELIYYTLNYDYGLHNVSETVCNNVSMLSDIGPLIKFEDNHF